MVISLEFRKVGWRDVFKCMPAVSGLEHVGHEAHVAREEVEASHMPLRKVLASLRQVHGTMNFTCEKSQTPPSGESGKDFWMNEMPGTLLWP